MLCYHLILIIKTHIAKSLPVFNIFDTAYVYAVDNEIYRLKQTLSPIPDTPHLDKVTRGCTQQAYPYLERR